jgi:ribose transport system substrate-binding protein
MHKKSLGIAVAVGAAALLAITGCGSSPSASSASAKKSVVFIQEVTGNDFSSTEACGVHAGAKKYGYSYSTTGPSAFDATQQTQYVNSVAAKSPSGVLIGPDDNVALKAPMLAMKSRGIKLVELDTSLQDKTISISHISSDNTAGGELAAKTLSKLIDAKGSVLIVGLRPGITTDDQRIAGFRDWITKNAPEIKLIATQYDNNDPAKSASIVTAQLSSTPELNAIFGVDLNNVVGAATGLKQAGAASRVKLVGFDAGPQ